MPRTRVVFYREEGGSVPVLEWFATLPAKAQAKCLERIQFLAAVGHEARRPHADYLRDGIYELRAKWGTVNLPHPLLLPRNGRGCARSWACQRGPRAAQGDRLGPRAYEALQGEPSAAYTRGDEVSNYGTKAKHDGRGRDSRATVL